MKINGHKVIFGEITRKSIPDYYSGGGRCRLDILNVMQNWSIPSLGLAGSVQIENQYGAYNYMRIEKAIQSQVNYYKDQSKKRKEGIGI